MMPSTFTQPFPGATSINTLCRDVTANQAARADGFAAAQQQHRSAARLPRRSLLRGERSNYGPGTKNLWLVRGKRPVPTRGQSHHTGGLRWLWRTGKRAGENTRPRLRTLPRSRPSSTSKEYNNERDMPGLWWLWLGTRRVKCWSTR